MATISKNWTLYVQFFWITFDDIDWFQYTEYIFFSSMSELEKPTSPENGSSTPNTNSSLLQEILQTAKQWAESVVIAPSPAPSMGNSENNIQPTAPILQKKNRDPMTTGMILKLIGSVLIVALIVFGSFLAYIVFNPTNAVFFVSVFNIDPTDIKKILSLLINWIFGIMVFIFAIAWVVTLFRAIWTPRDQKRKRTMNWILAAIIGIFLFWALWLWAFLFEKVGATPWDNLSGTVIAYDNDLYIQDETKSISKLKTTKNLIGPITIKYDISTNAKSISDSEYLTIQSYEFNSDGWVCANGESIISGTDPNIEQWLICTFDQAKTYNVRGIYEGIDKRTGEVRKVAITPESVEIKWLLDINRDQNRLGKQIFTINASRIKNLGNPRWIYDTDKSQEKTQDYVVVEISKTPLVICLKVFGNICDRIFIVKDTETNTIRGTIAFDQSIVNPRTVHMTLSGLSLDPKEIINIDWMNDSQTRMCRGEWLSCEYTFTSFGKNKVTATIELSNKKKYEISWEITIDEPLTLAKHGKIYAQDGSLITTDETYDAAVGAYVVKNLTLPQKVTLDAQDVITENPGYLFKEVVWTISSNTQKIDEKVGQKVIFDVPKSERYTIEAKYTFQKNIVNSDKDIRTARDSFILDLDRKALQPVMNISTTGDYVPAKVTVDASSSYSANGEIKKFTFDFGEGRPPAIGDAIQTYQYTTAGEKKITLTIINEKWESSSIVKTVVLKDTPKTIGYSTSMSPWVVGMPVDFIADKSSGQIEEYIWNFGDNSPISRGYEVTHTFANAGTYSIMLTVRYSDGTEKSLPPQAFKVETSLE